MKRFKILLIIIVSFIFAYVSLCLFFNNKEKSKIKKDITEIAEVKEKYKCIGGVCVIADTYQDKNTIIAN